MASLQAATGLAHQTLQNIVARRCARTMTLTAVAAAGVSRFATIVRRYRVPLGDDEHQRAVGENQQRSPPHCQLEQSEGDFRRFASAIRQLACDV